MKNYAKQEWRNLRLYWKVNFKKSKNRDPSFSFSQRYFDSPCTISFNIFKAAKKAGLCDDAIATALKRMKDQDVKDRLAQYTKQALEEGVSTCIPMLGVKYPRGRCKTYNWKEAV